jgi:hypothetical protein
VSVNGSANSAPVVEQVMRLTETAASIMPPGPLADEALVLRRRLDGPLRVAFAGRVKAGKSTLLNALVGERLAPTDAGECTRLVTTYQDGIAYGVTALMRDGRRQELDFRRQNGALSIELGQRPIDSIHRLEVSWPSSELRTTTLIDTPGLASINDDNSLRTREFFALEDGRSREADAVIYLMRHMHRSDAQFLESFLDRSVGPVSPLNAVAVLSRADEIGAGRPDAMESAARIAGRYRKDEQLRSLCATVVPIAGLLAETGQTLREDEMAALRTLAGADGEELDSLLLSVDRFCSPRSELLPEATRRALLARLGLFGVRLSIGAIRQRRVSTATELSRLLVDTSGLAELRRVLAEHFMPRARVLQARTALAALHDLVRRLRDVDAPAADRLEHGIERIEASAHEFAELRLAYMVLIGAVSLSPEEQQEVRRLTQPANAAARVGLEPDAGLEALSTAAVAGIERWRTRAEDPLVDPLTAEAASIAARSYEALFVAARQAQIAGPG